MNSAKPSPVTFDDIQQSAWNYKIIEGARQLGVSPASVAIAQGSYPKYGIIEFWNEPILSSSMEAELPNAIRLAEDKNILSDLAWSISRSFQFPVNTIFTHGLGVVASAMSKAFKFEYQQGL